MVLSSAVVVLTCCLYIYILFIGIQTLFDRVTRGCLLSVVLTCCGCLLVHNRTAYLIPINNIYVYIYLLSVVLTCCGCLLVVVIRPLLELNVYWNFGIQCLLALPKP